MVVYPHYLMDVILWAICVVVMLILARWTSAHPSARARKVLYGGLFATFVWLSWGVGFATHRVSSQFPRWLTVWTRCGAVVLTCFLLYTFVLVFLFRRLPAFNPERRRLLTLAGGAAFAAPIAVTSFAIIQRNNLQFVEAEIPMPGLPADLDGLRIVQLSDIHLGPFVSEAVLKRAVGMANETRAHLALITGDLISQRGDPLEACLRLLAKVKSDAGMLGCLGNHEVYARSQDYTENAGLKLGIEFLRHRSKILQFGSARLNFAGVDYQRKSKAYLKNTEHLIVSGATNVLLSHNPDVFPVAARKGFDLTLAGHTHGGQVNFEILHENVNIARFLTPYVYGHYQEASSSLFVTRGIGTVGVPARLGAPPEVALIRLCAT